MNPRNVPGWLAAGLLCGVTLAATGGGATPWTEVLTQRALAGGYPGTLPPHLSMVLGLTRKPTGLPVRRLVSRNDLTVRTLNVSVARHQDVVLLLDDLRNQSTAAYLVSTGGKLRKAVSYHNGEAPQELSAAEAQTGFAEEVRYWSEEATHVKPAGQAPAGAPAATPTPVPPATNPQS
jgi:hypothetical protein